MVSEHPESTPLSRYLEQLEPHERAEAVEWASTDERVFRAEIGLKLRRIEEKLDRPAVRAQLLVMGGAASVSLGAASFGDEVLGVIAKLLTAAF